MATSGRDRDPAFRKKTTPSAPKKPIHQESPKPIESKAITDSTGDSENPKSESEIKKTPIATPAPEEKTSIRESQPVPPPIKETPPKSLTDITEPPKSITPADPPPPKTKPAEDKKEPSHEGKTSKKSKLMGIIVAIVFIIALVILGSVIMNHISESEKESTEGGATEMPAESSEYESESSAEETTSESDFGADFDNGETENSEAVSSTNESNNSKNDLSDDNSFEKELNEAKVENPKAEPATNEKSALKTKIVRKKGDFEIPCWIIAFSANSKKPIANTNYSTLEALGYDAGIYWIPKYFPSDKELYKVYVGPYKSAEDAQSMLPAIRNLQPDAYVMKIEE